MAIMQIEVLHDICSSVFCCIGSALVRNISSVHFDLGCCITLFQELNI